MLPASSVSLPLPEPVALLDATLLFLIQVLIARHPDLLTPPDTPSPSPAPGLRAARRILDGVRELHQALELYRLCLPDVSPAAGSDDIPF